MSCKIIRDFKRWSLLTGQTLDRLSGRVSHAQVASQLTAARRANSLGLGLVVLASALFGVPSLEAQGTGIVGYWQFNNAANPGWDSSPWGHSLAPLHGTLQFTNDGPFGASVYLDGQTTLTTLAGSFPACLPTNASPYTIAVWEKADPKGAANGGFVGWGLNSYGQANNFRLNGPNSVVNYWYGNDFIISGLTNDPSDGKWHALVVTWDGLTQTFYEDGLKAASQTTSPPNVQPANFVVGQTTADVNFTGWLADLLIVNRAMTPSEVAAYQAGNWQVPAIPGTPLATATNPVPAGTTLTLSVPVTGTPPFQYQWQKNGTNLTGATTATLLLTNVLISDAGGYAVQVGNLLGTNTSPTLKVTVNPGMITAGYWPFNNPTNLGVDRGSLFNPLTAASGQPVYSPDGPFGGSVYLDGNCTLTTLSGLFPNGVPTNAAPYTVAVWAKTASGCPNNGGIVGWGFNSASQANSFRLNGHFSLENYWYANDFISGTGTNDPKDGQWHALAVTWDGTLQTMYVDGVSVGSQASPPPNVQPANFIVGKTTADVNFNGWLANLLIASRALSPAEIALYQTGNWSAPPGTVQPVAAPANVVAAGTTVSLSVPETGTPPFSYQWLRNGTNLPWGNTATLVLTNLAVADSGDYSVQVSNSAATVTSPAVTVSAIVPGSLYFTQQPSPVTNYENGLATFTATVAGTTPITLQWQCNGTNLPGQNLNWLILPNLQTNQTGIYTLLAFNRLGTNVSAPAQLTVLPVPADRGYNVLVGQHDNLRTGANTNEFVLTPGNVNATSFGKLFTRSVDGAVYAQPLYVSGLDFPGRGVHNALFVATQHGTVYAFDADNNQGANAVPLWQTSFINPAAGVTPNLAVGYCGDIPYEECIAATPVIDLAGGTIYVEAVTAETTNGVEHDVQRLHALNLLTGAEQTNSPVVIQGSVPGTGIGGDGTNIVFDGNLEQCRTALLLQNGQVYFAFSSHCDAGNYHGWVMAYDAHTLQQTGLYNTTPNGSFGGIWQGSGGLVGDASGAVFLMTGNGDFNTNYSVLTQANLSESFLKFNPGSGLVLTDYFTPYNQAALTAVDLDLAAGCPMGLPDAAGSVAHPHLLVGAGKDGTIYLVDRDHLGHYNSAQDSQIVAELPNAMGIPPSYPVPAYFNNTLYYQASSDVMRAFALTNATLSPAPVAVSSTTFGPPGGVPGVSANGTSNAIVWVVQTDGWPSGGTAILHAYNATNLAELYNSGQAPKRDVPGPAVKWVAPTVAGGKVYVGGDFTLDVFGVGAFLPTPTVSPAAGNFTNSVVVTLADAVAGAAIYYTLDGTTPGTNAILYTGPLVLTNTTGLQVIATLPGAVSSSVVVTPFISSTTVGSGTGLTGAYYAGQAGTFTNAPTLVRVDPTINFDWSSTGPATNIGPEIFTTIWTGSIQPQFNETYTFFTTVDDGVRLFVNGQELINEWVGEPVTTYQAAFPMKAGQLYTIEMDYFQGLYGAVAKLQWFSPSQPLSLVPTSQLYPYTNPPPVAVLTAPLNGTATTAGSSLTLTANAAAQYNRLDQVSFYTNGVYVGAVSNAPYALTISGLAPGSLALTAVATDGSGLTGTSAPVNITIKAGSTAAYGLTNRAVVAPAFNLSASGSGRLPLTLSQVGVFSDTTNLVPARGLLPYAPNAPFWSDNAIKSRWLAVPWNGGLATPDQQIGFTTNGAWSFPAGSVFVKHFSLVTDQTQSNAPLRRLETRLLVRDNYGAVFGATYKWRPDNSDADLLTNSLNENILITTSTGTQTQTWFYPSPANCLSCHTAAAGYVLGVNTRQLNGNFDYPGTGVADNQLRALNHLGLFNPAFDEAAITNFSQMVALTNQNATLENRARSYVDVNCAYCHMPGGSGRSFDARYDTPLTSQNLIYGPVVANLGVDNAYVIKPQDIWRSMLYQRASSLVRGVKMPPLGHYLVDTNGMAVMAAWINSLPGIPALPPPAINPAGASFVNAIQVALQPPDTNATLYYTLDGSLPTPASFAYAGPFILTNSATVSVNAFATGYTNSIAVSRVFTIQPPVVFTGACLYTNGGFAVQIVGVLGKSYVLQTSPDLVNWSSVSTNAATASPLYLLDQLNDPAGPARFYRAYQQP